MNGLNMAKYKITWIQTHPTQYVSPLLKRIAKKNYFDINVLYVSDFSTKKYFDNQFSSNIKWDIDLLNGYKYIFLNNQSKGISFFKPFVWPSLDLFKLINNSDYIIIQGWQHYILVLLVIFSKILGKKVIQRSETPVKLKLSNERVIFKKSLIHLFLSSLILNFSDYFLFIGTLNKNYYLKRGIDSKRLFFSPYAVDNKLFNKQNLKISHQLLAKLEFNNQNPVMLYASKLTERKNIMLLLKTFKKSFSNQLNLLIIGTGPLSNKVEEYININKLSSSIKYLGFVNQKSLPFIYSKSDIFILPSFSEKWGVVINEAMYGSCAIITSNEVGASYDIVQHRKNGYVYNSIKKKSIEKAISYCLEKKRYILMGEKSKQIIENWNYEETIKSLDKIMFNNLN